jgi:hypothetical protein
LTHSPRLPHELALHRDKREDHAAAAGSGETAMAEQRDATMSAELARRFERLPQLVNGDAALVRRGRFLTVDCLVELGEAPYYLTIAAGRVAAIERGPKLMRPWRFAVRAGAAAWRRFWAPMPAPGDHDLLALAKRGELRIEGDLHPFMANLLYFKDVLAAPRRAGAAP